MIKVNLLGGAKKSFATDSLVLDCDGLALDRLLEILGTKKPENAPDLDVDNILVAVNGVDSSALDGGNTTVNSGDTVSIIPVIHGGAQPIFRVQDTDAAIVPVRGGGSLDYGFLDSLRAQFPDATIQAVSSDYVLNASHARKILAISLESKKRGTLLSDKLETDILLRFSATTQISRAISDLGIRPDRDFVIIALGDRPSLEGIVGQLSDMADPQVLLRDNSADLQRRLEISKEHLDSVSSETPLEDVLQERASVLF